MENQIIEKSIIGEVKLSYSKQKEVSKTKISCSRDIEKFIREIFPLELINHREYAYAIFLDRANQILGYFMISSGGVSGTIIDPKIVFQSALLSNASGIIIFHNHPSGNPVASRSDIQMTIKLSKAGKILDHIIITEKGYSSFADDDRI